MNYELFEEGVSRELLLLHLILQLAFEVGNEPLQLHQLALLYVKLLLNLNLFPV